MKRLLYGLAFVLVFGGILSIAGGCEGECFEAIGVGFICLIIGAVVSNCLEKGCDDAEED